MEKTGDALKQQQEIDNQAVPQYTRNKCLLDVTGITRIHNPDFGCEGRLAADRGKEERWGIHYHG